MPVHPFDTARGRIETIEIDSEALKGNLLGDPSRRSVAVYLPEGYEEATERRYPVLYMHDGQNLFHDADATFGVAWEDGPWLVSVDGYYSGRLHDQGGEFTYPEPREREVPGRVRVIDVAARWQATEQLSFFARVENVTDDDYVTTPSAPAGPPLGAFVGAQWDF